MYLEREYGEAIGLGLLFSAFGVTLAAAANVALAGLFDPALRKMERPPSRSLRRTSRRRGLNGEAGGARRSRGRGKGTGMRLLVLTRTALGAQILVGGVLFILAYLMGFLLGLVPGGDVREIMDAIVGFLYAIVVAAHVILALATPVLALVALRPGRRGLPDGPLPIAAWLAPLAPLALGLGLRFGLIGGLAVVVVHMALGFAAFGLAAAVQQKAMRG